MARAVILDGLRTPFLNATKSIAGLTARALGVKPVDALLVKKPELRQAIDCVVGANVGNQLLPPDGSNIARLIALDAGIPKEVSARTININCGSGLEAMIDAVMRVECGLAKCVLVTGVEVMSDYTAFYTRRQRPLLQKKKYLPRVRMPKWQKVPAQLAVNTKVACMSHDPLWMIETGLTDPYCQLGMDKIGDALAGKYEIDRKELDLFALLSQRKAAAAKNSGRLNKEITWFVGKNTETFTFDNGIRENADMNGLAKLRPLNPGGTVTPGNASQISDGAAALIVANRDWVNSMGWRPLAAVRSENTIAVGCEPSEMGLGPAYAIARLLRPAPYYKLNDFGLIETNEAFASVPIAQSRELDKLGFGEFNWERVNPNGGAIAIGHPVGASGVRLALTAAMEIALRGDLERALVTLCIGGGQGVAAILEKP